MQTFTRQELRDTVNALGGEAEVRHRLELTSHALRAAYDERRFPARWYAAFCTLADERGVKHPPVEMFNMREILAGEAVEEAHQ